MKKFDIPSFYLSGLISGVKTFRKEKDKLKRDVTPTRLNFGPIQIYLARHFGFCYGVENAIEISYRAIEENPDKNIYLLSQMIHNPQVNEDLLARGLKFISDTEGNQLISWDTITSDDIVIIPAFGTTLEIEKIIADKNINVEKYNTTCPFVEKVWNRAEKLGKENYTIIIHGKAKHEETRATFSHSRSNAPSVIVKDMNESQLLSKIILGELPENDFYQLFEGKFSAGFDVKKDLQSVGVINQTTMLASETQGISDFFKQTMIKKYGEENIKQYFADTRDTLCYATNDNQQATLGLLEIKADMAMVIGGYNSSNTSHIVELLEQKFKTFFINGPNEFDEKAIHHFHYETKQFEDTLNFLPNKNPIKIIVTSGASCPDAIVEEVISKLISFFPESKSKEEVLKSLQ